MGSSSSVPHVNQLVSLIQGTSTLHSENGLSFMHIHTFSPSTQFMQSLSIQPRVFPVELHQEKGEPITPGSYVASLSHEYEDIKLDLSAAANNFNVGASIPINDDFKMSFSTQLLPEFNVGCDISCVTNVINGIIGVNAFNGFNDLNANANLSVALTNSFFAGGTIQYDTKNKKPIPSVTAFYQGRRFYTGFFMMPVLSVFSTAFFLGPAMYVGVNFQNNKANQTKLLSLGYQANLPQVTIDAAIDTSVTASAKVDYKVHPNLSVSTSLSVSASGFNTVGLGLQLQTNQGFAI